MKAKDEASESRLMVRIELSKYDSLMLVAERIRRIFDLGADPKRISEHLSKTCELKSLVESRPGLRVPGVWDGFELIIKMLVQEHARENSARTLLDKLIQTFGPRLKHESGDLTHLFPTPKVLSKSDSKGLL